MLTVLFHVTCDWAVPDKSEDYIHRVGRVGRADALGLAISLVSAVPEKVGVEGCDPQGLV
jgi:superfamily II DNA/RNA helicase